jgi:hypothetical protein
MTQLLLNVEDGYGHVVVMLGNAADVIRRCNEQCEPTEITDGSQDNLKKDNTEEFYEIMATKFQKICYGMTDAEDAAESYMTNCEPDTATMNSAPVHKGSSDISWGSPAAEEARQTATRVCGRVIVFTARHDCFALTSSVLNVGDNSNCWGKGLRAAGFENIIGRYDKSNKWIEISAKKSATIHTSLWKEYSTTEAQFSRMVATGTSTQTRYSGIRTKASIPCKSLLTK